ncbi:MAG: sigma-54 dependent transcriptional regulator [Oligoflexia bacterium]|nr:sigma-54 dependent transcriptional regulator [Oligoflexia bacterium]
MAQREVFIVDDQAEVLLSLTRGLGAAGLRARVQAFSRADQALKAAEEFNPQCCVIDLNIEASKGIESGFALLTSLLRRDPSCRIVVLTSHHQAEHGVRALNLGAASFLAKPAEIPHLLALINDGCAQADLRRDFQQLAAAKQIQGEGIVLGRSSKFRTMLELLNFAARTSQPVLLYGETGTGKGVLARMVHRISARQTEHFVRYQPNFATADLVNSELFGHLRGAFTGAGSARNGLLREAHRGTLFLDEVEALPLETQVALLGVLQEQTFRPLGSDQEIPVDLRLISASNQDLDELQHQGKLRRDFYHRIAHLRITIPALRERREDIPELAQHFLAQSAARDGLNVFEFEPSALDRLSAYSWPGNVRELEAVVRAGALRAQLANSSRVRSDDLDLKSLPASTAGNFQGQIEEFKVQLVNAALQRHGGNQVRAAAELGIDRSTLRRTLVRNAAEASTVLPEK